MGAIARARWNDGVPGRGMWWASAALRALTIRLVLPQENRWDLCQAVNIISEAQDSDPNEEIAERGFFIAEQVEFL